MRFLKNASLISPSFHGCRNSALLVDAFGACLDSQLKGYAVAVSFDRKFDASALAWGGGPGSLPELIGRAIGADHRNFGDADHSRAVAR